MQQGARYNQCGRIADDFKAYWKQLLWEPTLLWKH